MTDPISAISGVPFDDEATGAPPEPLLRLFARFLKFGFLAWGGPVAQIAMIRQELVEEERWVSREHFTRVLAVYQVLPGPEAHELCVYFGNLARGRIGGVLAGLGFMLPGFVLMLILSVLYTAGITAAGFRPLFLGVQPAVVALVGRAVHRIGAHAVTTSLLGAVAAAGTLAQLASVPFWMTLSLSGTASLLAAKRRSLLSAIPVVVVVALAGLFWHYGRTPLDTPAAALPGGIDGARSGPSVLRLLWSGLRAGLLTFGGAYTVLPFLQRDAVRSGGWMTNAEFLDGVALSGILPAPFIIFATFVGYVGAGAPGALALTVGVFLPAFAFTLIAHRPLERLVLLPSVNAFLEGVTAGVVGLIAATTLVLFEASVRSLPAFMIFAAALGALYLWRAKAAVAGVVLAAGIVGLLIFR